MNPMAGGRGGGEVSVNPMGGEKEEGKLVGILWEEEEDSLCEFYGRGKRRKRKRIVCVNPMGWGRGRGEKKNRKVVLTQGEPYAFYS